MALHVTKCYKSKPNNSGTDGNNNLRSSDEEKLGWKPVSTSIVMGIYKSQTTQHVDTGQDNRAMQHVKTEFKIKT